MRTAAIVFVVFSISGILLAGDLTGQEPEKQEAAQARAALGKLPLYFIENGGVYAEEVAYYVKGADKTLFFTSEGVTFLLKGKDRGWTVKLDFVGANPDVRPRGEDRQEAVFSYFKGKEADWKAGLPTFKKVVYRDLWPGIDLVYKGTVNQLKYEFVVHPGADPDPIALKYRGAARLSLTESGGLRVETPEGSFEDAAPFAYQEVDGKRVPVEMAFDLDRKSEGSGSFGFRLGRFDRTRPLILDPAVLVYCGYIGGTGTDYGYGISVDASGNTYVTGMTQSNESSFPVKVGPDLTYNGTTDCDAFVVKVNAAGTGLVYCGYIGGTGSESGYDISVDASGNAYVTGYTKSNETSFPVTVGPDLTYNGTTDYDAFVAKVSLTLLEGSGTYRPGTTVALTLTASESAGFAYQLASSFGTGPIPIDTRQIGLSMDWLMLLTIWNVFPTIFSNYAGIIDAQGTAQAAIHLLNEPALVGYQLHTAFVTISAAAPSGIQSISNTYSFKITN